ncbi:AAA domain-containing protein [Mycoplasmopsis ciconiae]|uniref:AAA domain-containing protein n=1 Tax=Mycoplasmopsis ciconiae TaxID=561067 RepID=A0ABU7ML13_9BACT|nr:AAA domain-containing protein [Mycoplasmopsis ciconiae]
MAKTTVINNNYSRYEQLEKVNKSKHKKLVNNLLDIRPQGDNAIFYHISKINQDLSKIVKKQELNEIFNKSDFRVEISSNFTDTQIQKLYSVKTLEEFSQWAKDSNFKPSAKMEKDLTRSFANNISEVIDKISSKHNNFLKEWKFNINKIQEIYAETGVWPLYVGTYFLKVSRGESAVNAPLLLKAVDLSINDGKIILTSRDSSVIINEKLKYTLDASFQIKIPELRIKDESSLKEVVNDLRVKMDGKLVDDLANEINLTLPYKELQREDVTNSTLNLCEGMVLTLTHPIGTKLREALTSLIINDQIDNIIKTDNFENYNASVSKDLVEKSKIVRVAQSDITQEKAIIGALKSSCVIVGPPGTGKSQTIANILVNVLKNNKKALFISQKKVALDVVLKRMGKYSDLVFQFNESSKANKFEKGYFYEPIKRFYQQILDLDITKDIPKVPEKFLSNIEYEYHDAKNDLGVILNQDLDAFFRIKKSINIDEKKDKISKVLKYLNDFRIKSDLLKILNKWSELKGKVSSTKMRKRVAKELKYFLPEQDNYETIKKNLKFYDSKKYDKKFIRDYKNAKKIKKYMDKELPGVYVEDLIRMGTIMKLNSFLDFDEIESQYKLFVDNRNVSNVTKEQLETLYLEVARRSKNNLSTYVSEVADGELLLNTFLGKVQRGLVSPQSLIYEYKDLIKRVYNVFVGTPEILSNFVDFNLEKYDYVIFDESSQIFIEKALPYLSISKNFIIAGDPQQMQPTNWFNKRDESDDIYTNDEVVSLLDWASNYNIPKYYLEMNYRSNASELILFSSKEFYESKLKGIDRYNFDTGKSFEVYDVNGKWKDNKNTIEAEFVVDLAEKNLDQHESMIILAFNRKQQDCIREIISLRSPKLYQALENKVILRNLENIQGDEADIVICSVGYTKEATLSSTYIGTKGGRNALNVAITRAKSKMIVVKSLKAEDLLIDSSSSLNIQTFKRWLEFLELPLLEQKSYTSVDKSTLMHSTSYFELDVLNWLKTLSFNQEFKLKTNYRIGSYTIDIAILSLDNKFLVGISLDDTGENSSINEMLEVRLKDDFILSKDYPIYRISNFRFREEKNAINRYLSMIINRY